MFNNKQLEVLKFNNKHRPRILICEGAVRSSKTVIMLYCFLLHVRQFKNHSKTFMITGYTIGSIKSNVIDNLNDLFGLDIELNKDNEFALFGNIIKCFGTEKSDSWKRIRGFTSYGWYANEITLSHRRAVDEAFKRNSGAGFRIFMDTNPDYPKHYIKTEIINNSGDKLNDGTVRIKSFHFTIWDNAQKNGGFLTDEYIENLMKITPSGHLYDRDILGLWVTAEGMIYKDYSPDIHLINSSKLKNKRFDKYVAGVDWGFEHFGVILVAGVDSDGNYYIIEEIAGQRRTIDWWLSVRDELVNKYPGVVFYCDTARPEYVQQFKGVGADKQVMEGIAYVAGLFKQNKLFISDSCEKILNEIYEYRMSNRAGTEQPVKENDDAMDALRYLLYSDRPIKKEVASGIGANEVLDNKFII